MRRGEGATVTMATGTGTGEEDERKKADERDTFHEVLIEDGGDKKSPELRGVTLGSGMDLRF